MGIRKNVLLCFKGIAISSTLIISVKKYLMLQCPHSIHPFFFFLYIGKIFNFQHVSFIMFFVMVCSCAATFFV